MSGDNMNTLNIHNHCTESVTVVSNCFLDHYMPKANGEFVKIYLYLLRSAGLSAPNLTLSTIADAFDCTENDVERALRYWDKKGLLKLDTDPQNGITGITLLSPTLEAGGLKEVSTVQAVPPSRMKSAVPSEYVLTPDKVKELKQNEDIMQLLFIAEQYLGKTLSPTETSRILYFYDCLNFSADLIEYLIEYCVSKGSKSIRYMEKVALAWAEAGITTVDMAKQETNTYQKHYFSVLKAFGITGRNPVDSEIRMIDRWRNELGFTSDIIQEACSRTVTQTGKASFQYADGILSAWHKNGVTSVADIHELDIRHKKGAKKATANAPSKAPNKFNNFHQRDYNFSDLERQLLKK